MRIGTSSSGVELWMRGDIFGTRRSKGSQNDNKDILEARNNNLLLIINGLSWPLQWGVFSVSEVGSGEVGKWEKWTS